jgi:hypothetical protein
MFQAAADHREPSPLRWVEVKIEATCLGHLRREELGGGLQFLGWLSSLFHLLKSRISMW